MRNLAFCISVFLVTPVIVLIGPFSGAQSTVPMLINYQGELKSPSTGEPVGDGTYEMLFRIYDVEFGGTPLWVGTHSSLNGNPVELTGGIFHVILGSGTGNSMDNSIFSGPDRWLEIRVGMETLSPRQRITSVAYSVIAENSRLLDGQEASDFAAAAHAHSGADITSGAVAEGRIDPMIARDAEVDSKVGTHAAIPDAHHPKTTSFSELTDAASDSQIPGGIARDSEIMPTVLANDGTGSGLDADRIDGAEGATLEESAEIDADIAAHTAVAGAHHTKTTSFSELTDAASDTQIPGSIARDAEVTSAVSTHTAIADAHHARYTDAEAVAAMGAKANTNPLNHDRTTSFSALTDVATDSQIPAAIARDAEVDTKISDHTAIAGAHHTKTTSFTELTDTASDGQIPAGVARDSEIMPTVLANDGPGSALNADLLDGQDSAAFVTAISDYGRSGVAANLYEGTTTLNDKYVNVSGDGVTGNLTVDGSVGVGTTSPAAKLHVSGGAVSVYKDDGITNGEHELARFERSETTSYPGIRLGYRANGAAVTGGYLRGTGAGGDLQFGVSAVPQALTIGNGGNVGIGTTSPSARLEVVSTAGQDNVQIGQGEVRTNNGAGGTSRFVAAIGGVGYWGLGKTNSFNNDFHIINYPSSRWDLTVRNDTGRVGIGTTSPQEKLDVNGNARVAGDLTVVGAATFGGGTMAKVFLTADGTIVSTRAGGYVLSWDKTNGEIELSNTSGDWCDYWWQAQKGATTSGNSGATNTGTSNVAIISGTNNNDYGFEVHFGQADGTGGWCSVWLQYANGGLVGHYMKY